MRSIPVSCPLGTVRRRIVLDPGHGAPNNTGNLSSYCVHEQDFTLLLAMDVARHLEATGCFDVRLSRLPGELVPYPDRVRAADDWPAHAIVSLHSDVRGAQTVTAPTDPAQCPHHDSAPGFALLWSDEAPEKLAKARRELAVSVAKHMRKAGFGTYHGAGYEPLYAADSGQPGVFVDRHQPARRIYLLKAPRTPSVIVETHHAWNRLEAARWAQPDTTAAFASALAAALLEQQGS